jgi:hypothetical protein
MSTQLKKSLKLGGIDNDHDYRVRIPFELSIHVGRNISNWNETCARAIELFGLPGEKYTCRFTKNFIEFWFLEEKDALLFELCCG